MTTKLHKSAVFAVAVVVLATSSPAADNDVLYWMVDSSSATVSSGSGNSSLSDFFSSYDQPADSSFAARVRVTGGDVSGDTFLDLYYPGEQNEYFLVPGDLGVEMGDFSSAYMQSPLGAYGSPEYSFIVEIGNVVWSDGGYNGSWTETLAVSAATGYASLANYISQIGSTGLPQSAVWTPSQFTAVPEPSSGVLAIMGFALLALRRRKYGKGA